MNLSFSEILKPFKNLAVVYYQGIKFSVNSTSKVTLKFFWKEAQIDRIASKSDKSSWNILLAKKLPNLPKFKTSYLMKFIFIVFPCLGPILELQLKITGEQECPVMQ